MNKLKKALIFGISGQDGKYLTDELIKKKIIVHGFVRKKKLDKKQIKKIKIFKLNKNYSNLHKVLKRNYDYIFFLGGQNSVIKSFKILEQESYSSHIKPLEIILEFIRKQKKFKSKFLFASSSEIFGDQSKKKLNVDTEKNPLSPYGLSKLIGFEIVKSYREMFKLPVFSIIFFNHESNLRKKDFVFKKISNYLKTKKQNKLSLGNIDIKRDWGFSHEYMKIIVKIIQSSKKNDYVVATGKTISLRNVVQNQFKRYNLNYKNFIRIDKKLIRENDIRENYADISNLIRDFNIRPKINYKNLLNYF